MQCYPFIHSDDPDCAEAADDLQLVCAHDCPPQPLQWLWPDKIPLGKVTLLIGDPGTGKSLVALDIAARASRGGAWPEANDETRMPNDETSDHSSFDIRHSSFPAPSSTILLSASDDLADTIRPRLDAAGADPRRVFVIPSIANLRDDFKQLRDAVSRVPNCRLIIIDPINAYVGPSDSHFQTVVRKILEPLAKLAAEKRIAIIAIAHLRKNEGDAIYRAAGLDGLCGRRTHCLEHLARPRKPRPTLAAPGEKQRRPRRLRLSVHHPTNGPARRAGHRLGSDTSSREGRAQEVGKTIRRAHRSPRMAPPCASGRPTPRNRRHRRRPTARLPAAHAPARVPRARWPHCQTRPPSRLVVDTADHSAENLAGDCPDLAHGRGLAGHHRGDGRAESSEQNVAGTIRSGMVPFAQGTPKTADIFEDVTYEQDTAAQQQLDEVLTARPPLSHSIATLERLDRQRRNDRRSNDPSTGKQRPPTTTGHPILDAILDDIRKTSPTTTSNTS